MSSTPTLPFTTQQVAAMLGCAESTIETHARSGHLPGVLFGDGGYVFPAGALFARLDELALEEAAARRKPAARSGVLHAVTPRAKRSPPALPSVAP